MYLRTLIYLSVSDKQFIFLLTWLVFMYLCKRVVLQAHSIKPMKLFLINIFSKQKEPSIDYIKQKRG